MFLALERWRSRREKERIQEQCPHDWHVTSTESVDSGRFLTSYDWVKEYNLFCPICEKEDFGISEIDWARLRNITKIRKEYNQYGGFPNE